MTARSVRSEDAGLSAAAQALCMDQCLIGGEWIAAEDGAVIEVENPATRRIIGKVPALGCAETDKAISMADAAGKDWARTTAAHRAKVLRTWYDLICRHQDALAEIMTAEQGKPLTEALGEVAYGAAYVEWFAEEAKRAYGETIPGHTADKRLLVIPQPIGVCAAITPWNFPIAMITRKVAPALAAGCTMIVKPASVTPLSALALARLAEMAGVPPGVLSVVTGSARQIGGAMTENPRVRKLSFTGSTEIGRQLMAACAPTVKKLSLELGGNAPLIVFDDADLEVAVMGAIQAKFRNNGQTCVCANRIYVQRGIYDAFAQAFSERVAALKVGPGTEEGVDLGPLIDSDALSKLAEHTNDALKRGARILTGGTPHELGGLFHCPTVLADVASDAAVANEETFGPLAPLIPFDTEDEVIALANASEFGLASYFFTRNVSRVWRMADRLEAGMVGINTGLISTEVAPFGGIKQSGLGREGSRHGLSEYQELKYLCLGV